MADGEDPSHVGVIVQEAVPVQISVVPGGGKWAGNICVDALKRSGPLADGLGVWYFLRLALAAVVTDVGLLDWLDPS